MCSFNSLPQELKDEVWSHAIAPLPPRCFYVTTIYSYFTPSDRRWAYANVQRPNYDYEVLRRRGAIETCSDLRLALSHSDLSEMSWDSVWRTVRNVCNDSRMVVDKALRRLEKEIPHSSDEDFRRYFDNDVHHCPYCNPEKADRDVYDMKMCHHVLTSITRLVDVVDLGHIKDELVKCQCWIATKILDDPYPDPVPFLLRYGTDLLWIDGIRATQGRYELFHALTKNCVVEHPVLQNIETIAIEYDPISVFPMCHGCKVKEDSRKLFNKLCKIYRETPEVFICLVCKVMATLRSKGVDPELIVLAEKWLKYRRIRDKFSATPIGKMKPDDLDLSEHGIQLWWPCEKEERERWFYDHVEDLDRVIRTMWMKSYEFYRDYKYYVLACPRHFGNDMLEWYNEGMSEVPEYGLAKPKLQKWLPFHPSEFDKETGKPLCNNEGLNGHHPGKWVGKMTMYSWLWLFGMSRLERVVIVDRRVKLKDGYKIPDDCTVYEGNGCKLVVPEVDPLTIEETDPSLGCWEFPPDDWYKTNVLTAAKGMHEQMEEVVLRYHEDLPPLSSFQRDDFNVDRDARHEPTVRVGFLVLQ